MSLLGENGVLHSNAHYFCKNEYFFIILATLLGNLMRIRKKFVFFVQGANLNFLDFLPRKTAERNFFGHGNTQQPFCIS